MNALGLKVLFGAPLVPFGIWVGYRWLVRDNWRDDRWTAILLGIGTLLFGGIITALGVAIMVL